MNKIKNGIASLFFLFTWLDFFSTVLCLNLGFFEQNILYYILSPFGFWVLYWGLSICLFYLLYSFNKYSYLILIIPLIVHLVCGVNNLGLIL